MGEIRDAALFIFSIALFLPWTASLIDHGIKSVLLLNFPDERNVAVYRELAKLP
jgi:hypothetical protein